jgi:hypothetical protein
MEPNNDRKPLDPITVSGTYKLKLIRPNLDWIKVKEDKTFTCRLMFIDGNGHKMYKAFSPMWAKPLAMLVGKFSSKFTSEIREDATPAEFLQYVEPACGQTCLIGVEAIPDGEWQGKPQFKYKLTYPKGSQKPVVNDLPNPEDVPY